MPSRSPCALGCYQAWECRKWSQPRNEQKRPGNVVLDLPAVGKCHLTKPGLAGPGRQGSFTSLPPPHEVPGSPHETRPGWGSLRHKDTTRAAAQRVRTTVRAGSTRPAASRGSKGPGGGGRLAVGLNVQSPHQTLFHRKVFGTAASTLSPEGLASLTPYLTTSARMKISGSHSQLMPGTRGHRPRGHRTRLTGTRCIRSSTPQGVLAVPTALGLWGPCGPVPLLCAPPKTMQ